MPHDIDLSTGNPAIAYVGDGPWHQLGERLTEGAPIEVWLRAARLEWELKRLPVQYLVGGMLRVMEDRFVLVRDDTNAALSIVSEDYKIVQPKEVLEFYRNLIRDHGYTLETAGALDGGRKVWALARTGITGAADNSERDGLSAYILFATSCDKTLATTVAFTCIRVVCQNTLFFALEDAKTKRRPQIKVPHTIQFDPELVKKQLELIDEAWSGFVSKVREMAAYQIDPRTASAFFEKLLPRKKDGTLTPRAQREYQTLFALFKSAPGQNLPSAKGTLWGALNAVTYYADYVRSGPGGERLDSAWFGPGFTVKENAWVEASAMISGQLG